MRSIRLSPLLLLLLLSACRVDGPPKAADPSQGPSGLQPGDPEPVLTGTRLGKEDFAQVEGELRCIDLHFGEGTPQASAAKRQALDSWGAEQEWVDGVRAHVATESAFAAKIEGSLTRRMEKVCPGGKLTAAYLSDQLPGGAAAVPAAVPPVDAATATPATATPAAAVPAAATPTPATPTPAPQ